MVAGGRACCAVCGWSWWVMGRVGPGAVGGVVWWCRCSCGCALRRAVVSPCPGSCGRTWAHAVVHCGAGSYPGSCGRTWAHAVVRCGAGSYPGEALRYDSAAPGTTAWIWARSRGVGGASWSGPACGAARAGRGSAPAEERGDGRARPIVARLGARGGTSPAGARPRPVEGDISARARRRRRSESCRNARLAAPDPGRRVAEPISARNSTDLEPEPDRSRRKGTEGRAPPSTTMGAWTEPRPTRSPDYSPPLPRCPPRKPSPDSASC